MSVRSSRLVFVAAWMLSLALAVSAAAQTRPPDIVVFISDDHGVLDSTVYGSRDVKTPSMDRLARAGLTFDRAFVASPSCAPSRAALLTGLMPARNGAEANHSKPRPDLQTLPAYLQALGYEVVAFGKVAHYKYTADYGFDHFAHDTFHDDVAIARGIAWLRQRKPGKPLCILFGTNWPHVPWPETDGGEAATCAPVAGGARRHAADARDAREVLRRGQPHGQGTRARSTTQRERYSDRTRSFCSRPTTARSGRSPSGRCTTPASARR